MKSVKNRKEIKRRRVGRILIGVAIGAGAGYLASTIAGASGSSCMILCNHQVAIPYFAAMGLLATWR
jgi:hypothetical protein